MSHPVRRPARPAVLAGVAAVATSMLVGVLGGSATAAPAAAATERADTIAQASDDSAIAAKQVVRERLHSAKDQDWFRYVFTGSTRVVVTLGSLLADYNLAVYRADGTRVAVSDHGGKGFERIYFTAAKGTYYVRVAATKGSSSAKYRLWLRTLAGPLALQSFTVPKVNSGYPFVVAEFVNTTPNWLQVGFISVSSIAADGRTLQTDGLAQQQTVVAPYGLVHVASSTVLPLPAGHDHYRVATTGTVTGSSSVAGLVRSSGPVRTEGGYRVHTGTVKNTGTTTRGGSDDQTLPSVDVTYYNANGTILGTALTNLYDEAIPPGRTVKYQVVARQSGYWHSPFPTPNRYATRLIAAR